MYDGQLVFEMMASEWQWLWNIMDSDTRYILASHVAQGRGAAEAQETFQIAKKNSNPEGEPTFPLNGKTPAEAAGIKTKGENKWLTLIQNASLGKGSSV